MSLLMPNALRDRLHGLASSFASSVLDVIRGVSLDQLLGEPSGRGGKAPSGASVRAAAGAGGSRRRDRLPRRSAGDIDKVVERIVGLLKRHPRGLRAEQIRDELGLEAKELPRPLKEALDTGSLHKSGQKRATTYFIKAAGGGHSKGGGRASGRGARGGRGGAGGRKPRGSAGARSSAKKVESGEGAPVEQPAQAT
jgi:hypothetical protein